MKGNKLAPHKAVIFIRAELHEVNARGECTGDPVLRVPLFPLVISGNDRQDAEKRLNELLAELKRRFN